jgi:hypothetical protein
MEDVADPKAFKTSLTQHLGTDVEIIRLGQVQWLTEMCNINPTVNLKPISLITKLSQRSCTPF